MILSTVAVFPNNVVELFATAFQDIDVDCVVLKRPLRQTDPDQSIGVFPSTWNPDEETFEIGRAGHEPTVSVYLVSVQAMIKAGNEEQGLAVHSILSKRIRTVLYRNAALAVALQSLTVTDGSSIERWMRGTIRTQRYMNDDIQGTFVYVSTLDYSIETESS